MRTILTGQFRLLLLALQFMSALPVSPSMPVSAVEIGRAIRYFPLVGLLLGSLVAVAGFLLGRWLPAAVTAALLVTLLALLTGGLHLDGLADACDGLPLTGNPADRLATMRSSQLGTRGALGLILLLLLKWALFTLTIQSSSFLVLPVALALARWTSVPAIVLFPYARPQGMSSMFKQHGGYRELAIATLIAAAITFSLWGTFGLPACAIACAALLLAGRLATTRLGGMTGDMYGALNECCEVLLLGFWLLAHGTGL